MKLSVEFPSVAYREGPAAVLRLARESTLSVNVSEKTWKAAAAHLGDQQLVELTLNIAWYNSGVRIMGLLDIDLEDAYLDPHH